MSKSKCMLIASAPETDINYIKDIANENKDAYVICVDGGYSHCLRLGIDFDMIIGDFDSCSRYDLPSDKMILQLPREKDASDLKYAMQYGILSGYNYFIILGACGGRLDHLLSNLSLLEYLFSVGKSGVIYDSNNMVLICENGKNMYSYDDRYKFISIIPIDKKLSGVTLSGLKYPLNKDCLLRDDIISISNECIDKKFYVEIENGLAYIIFSKD